MTIENQNEAVIPAPDQETTAAPDAVNEQPEEQQEPKTFTQEELDRIVGAEKAKVERKLRRELAQQPGQRQAPAEQPNPENFKTAEEYIEALSDWKADQKVANREVQQQRQQVETTFEERAEKARDNYTDYDDVVFKHPNDGGPAISDYMAEAIKESDLGPDIAYFLGKNPAESRRIYGLTPLAQAREIGKIEAKLADAAPATKKVSSAPEPIKPVNARTTTPKYDTSDPRAASTMSASDWIKARNAEIAKNSR